MNVKLLRAFDTKKLEEYLAPYKAECMFICSNLKAVGIEYRGEDFQGEYFGYLNPTSNNLYGVIVHYWNGNIMMHAINYQVLEHLVIELKNNIKRPVAGILGPNKQAEEVINHLGLFNANYNLNVKESLYKINLETLTESIIPNNFAVVKAQDISRELLINWMKSYDIEALGASNNDELEKEVEAHWNTRLKTNDNWVLLYDGIPVSLCAFNARIEEMVQVGPVWTPPEHRNKGFARLILTQMLVQEKAKGTKKAILFTDNPAAIKVYKNIGFNKIGEYRLALLEKPIKIKEIKI
ncbi:MAG: hypothetical protein BGO27_02655 [Alphaproteobacteria bacterium 33-17]|nr:MAG: hypothetical protein BGO27_02655 [Alphaproteobacteria bacterium 33-17]